MTSPNETNEEPSAQAVFPPVDSEAWRQRVDKELKGARFDDTLVHRTREGLTIQPLYTRASLPSGFDPAARPGQAPFVRGARTAGGWQVAQTIRQPRVGEAASAIGADQERGVELFWLYFAGSDRSRRGIEASSVDDVAVLQQALTEDRSVILQGGDSALSRAAVWVAAARRSGLELGLLRGNWGCDPLARLATFGRLAGSLEQAFRQQADLLAWTLQEAPAMRSALVSLRPYHEAGCTPAQELAFALATGAETLRRLSAAGLAIERIAGQVDFAFCVGRDLFTEIAKLRAARLLWTKVLHAWGCGDRARTTKIHALTSPLEASQIDPWSNLLRVGAQGFAAALGNVDSLVLAAFDEAAGSTDAAGRRLAVSGQHVLAEEAALGRVADPAGGSWYIESLTDTLARAAWQLFREIEECGGMAQGLMDGGVARRVEKSAAQLRQDVDHRRTPIVGTSGFANLAETVQSSGRSQEAGEEAGGRNEPAADSSHPLHRVATDSGNLGDLMQAAIEAADSGTESVTLASALGAGRDEATGPRLAPFRLAERFEGLRLAGDRWFEQQGHRLRATLVHLGKSSPNSELSAYIRRLLAVAGIESASTSAGAASAANASEIAVVFDGGAERSAIGDAIERSRGDGARQVLLARQAGEDEAALRDLGIDGFVYDGCDVRSVLQALLEALEALR